MTQVDNEWKSFDITAAVKKFVATPSTNYGTLVCMDDRSGDGYRFFSSDNVVVGKRPKLTIDYTGGPAMAVRPKLTPGTDTMFIGSTTVTMSTTDGSTIRYTINGTDPTESSPAYSAPISVSATTTIKARGYKSGSAPSPLVSTTYTKISGIDYKYYEGTWTAIPDFSTLAAKDSGVTASMNLSVRKRNTNFGLLFTGTITIPTTATYSFLLNSSDGSRITIGTIAVVTNQGIHPAWEKLGTIALTAGTYPIKVEYFVAATNAPVLDVFWSSPTASPAIEKALIPPTVLGRAGTTTVTRHFASRIAGIPGSAQSQVSLYGINGSVIRTGQGMRSAGAGVYVSKETSGSNGVTRRIHMGK
jgi:hypothetical protein